jgi:protein TonB
VVETVAPISEATAPTPEPDAATTVAASEPPAATQEPLAPTPAAPVTTAPTPEPEALTMTLRPDRAAPTPEPVLETDLPQPAAAPGTTAIVPTPRGRSTESGDAGPRSAAIAGIALPEIAPPAGPPSARVEDAPRTDSTQRPAPAAVPSAGETQALSGDRPPKLLDRVEPVFDRRSLRPGERQTVVLRLLVDERGRPTRVVVEESVPGSDSEFAAINAVLRWSYEPALENGEPVRAWITERFEFSRPE